MRFNVRILCNIETLPAFFPSPQIKILSIKYFSLRSPPNLHILFSACERVYMCMCVFVSVRRLMRVYAWTRAYLCECAHIVMLFLTSFIVSGCAIFFLHIFFSAHYQTYIEQCIAFDFGSVFKLTLFGLRHFFASKLFSVMAKVSAF